MKISFLIHTIYGIGGTIRTTLNLAEELADRHEVEIVSVFRHRDDPILAIDPRITVVPLVDTRPASPANEQRHPLYLEPAELLPRNEARYKEYSRLTDERVQAHYAGSDADVVIGTRPGLVAYVAQFGPEGAVLIGQEHMTHNHHKPELRAEMYDHLARLDAFVTVSEGDAASYRAQMPLPATRVLAIPNSVPEPMVVPSDTSGTTVVAAGRLASEKQYHVLVEAFGKVVAARPEWTLRICGWGNQKDRLRRKIDELGLYNSVLLMGPRSPIEPEWVKGAIAVSTSRHESFGMTLVEAMRCGLPVVSTDCDYGPREIIADGVDGLLVPVGDVEAIAEALLKLIDDEELRRRMGAAALRNARRFAPGPVAKQYEELFAELGAATASRGSDAGHLAPAAGEGEPFAALADCLAADDGGLTVSLIPGGGRSLGRDAGLHLVCTHPDAAVEARRFAFDAEGRATVPAGARFPEGVWTCRVELPDGELIALATRAVDQRGSMRAAARTPAGGPVRTLVPYVKQGVLSLRSWVRPVHAEVGEIRLTRQRITVSGRLFAPGTPGGDRALLLRRRGKAPAELTFPASREGADGFRASVPCAAPADRRADAHDVWDLWLRYAPDEEPVRLARVLDDVVEKGSLLPYPAVDLRRRRSLGTLRAVVRRLGGKPQERVAVKVFYSAANELVLNVVDKAIK
ncbi:glycosyltransferase involved in cell wall biosynthesis [Streptomyces sp. SLBN-118]|uniref:glycosyltransferase family 4 protein n=1 Tax=Streptomyces sp. SLBN-118 TaxID=2768454 RepID=UPI001151BBCC|nr:glycosyltransferase family 4 protein [Streptomyces sp. SLBN-118]TQK44572.1 glycosyltransferase involved in cell wall biosynthesis [Streptomyces sp. SLBN-118]